MRIFLADSKISQSRADKTAELSRSGGKESLPDGILVSAVDPVLLVPLLSNY